MKIKHGVVVGALAGLTLTGVAVPAEAQLVTTTTCSGEFSGVAIPGNLRVLNGQDCSLEDSTVAGSVTVGRDADLVTTGSEIAGSVTVADNGYFDALDSTIAGGVRERRSLGVVLEGSSVAGAVNANASGFTYAIDSSVDGEFRVSGGELFAEGSRFGGDLIGQGNVYADVFDSVVEGNVTITRSEGGSLWCSSEVDGDVTLTRNSGVLQIGASAPFEGCGFNVFGGNVTVSDNTAEVRVSNNVIRGDVSGTGNDPAPFGQDNRIRGGVTGQFAELAPEPAEGDGGGMGARALSVEVDKYAEAREVISAKRAAAAKL